MRTANDMKTWTVEEMVAERPCPEYTRERMAELWAGREALSLLDILDLPISTEHRVWVTCRPDAITAAQRAAWLDLMVTRAVTAHALHCGIPAVEMWARGWFDGSDRTEASACAATWAAAEAAETGAARAAAAAAAAWTAADAAAWTAARAAAGAADAAAEAAAGAAWVAAGAAAWAAAEMAEREQQIDDLRQILSSIWATTAGASVARCAARG